MQETPQMPVGELNKYESIATVGESRVWWRADFQSGSVVVVVVYCLKVFKYMTVTSCCSFAFIATLNEKKMMMVMMMKCLMIN